MINRLMHSFTVIYQIKNLNCLTDVLFHKPKMSQMSQTGVKKIIIIINKCCSKWINVVVVIIAVVVVVQ